VPLRRSRVDEAEEGGTVMPAVSVIMPVYNVARCLREGVASVLGQTMSDLELILVDDGSTDGGGDLCDVLAAADSRVRVIHQENGGLSAARNAGLDVARAPLVLFCDSDDLLRPETCAVLSRAFAGNPCTDVVRCGVEVVRGDPKLCPAVGESGFELPDGTSGTLPCERAFETVDASACNKMFRRDVIGRFGISFKPGIVHEDFGFTLKFCMVAREMALVEDRLYRYVLRGDGIMGAKARTFAGARGYLEALDDAYRFLCANGLRRSRGEMFWRAYVKGFHCALADCPPADADRLYREAQEFLSGAGSADASPHVRSLIDDIRRGRRPTRRYGIGPVSFVKVTNRLDKRAVRILGIPVCKRTYS